MKNRIPRKLKKKLKKRYLYSNDYMFLRSRTDFNFAVITEIDSEGFVIEGFKNRKEWLQK